jgi:hypothetical protein
MMSVRGRRYYSHLRRQTTSPLKARALGLDVEIVETPETDADLLITSFRVRAYSEARHRQREAESFEASIHWSHVASVIARRTGERRGYEPSTRSELDADRTSSGAALGLRPAVRFFEADPVDELERALATRPQCFRLQFFGVGADLGPALLIETEIRALNASGAVREAVRADWPARATRMRLLDLEGHELFERFKADLR